MAKPTTTNPTGIEPYNHSELAALPEYKAAHLALDALVKALDRHKVDLTARTNYPSAQAAWLRVVQQMAASLGYADTCRSCRDTVNPDDFDAAFDLATLGFPYRVEISGSDLRGQYRCAHCGHVWTCNYSVNAPALMP